MSRIPYILCCALALIALPGLVAHGAPQPRSDSAATPLGVAELGPDRSPDRSPELRVAQADASTKRAPRLPPSAVISVDWKEIDLEELTKRMAEMTGQNFILAEELEGKKVTIFAPNQVRVDQAWDIYLSALRTVGYTVVPGGGDTLKIVEEGSAKSEPIETVTGPMIRNGQKYITRLIRLDNIQVSQLDQVLKALVSSQGTLVTYEPNNTLIITDTEVNIDRLMGIIEKLDVESPREVLEILEIHYAASTEIADIIRQVYGEDSGSSTSRTTKARTNTSSRARRNRSKTAQASSTNVEGGPSVSKIIPDERTNTIIILATEEALVDIKALVNRLDFEVDPLLKSDIHVMFLEHAKAEDLANTLSSLTSDAGRTSTSRTQRGGTTRSAAGASGQDNVVATFEGGVKVTADASTNALVITASYNDYIILKRVIDKLDVRRRQVFVEGVILELSQDRTMEVGLSYHGGSTLSGAGDGGYLIGTRGSNSLFPPVTDATSLAGMALGVFGAPISVSIPTAAGALPFDIPAFGVFLQALQSDQEINILSTPQIMTLNNTEAEIIVGENIPFLAGSTITGTGLQTVNITREDVALNLKVKPQVNEGDVVTLEVFQEITEVVAGTSDSQLGPTTTKRSATTTVSVPDNQTVVIGGLISSKLSTAESKVPILGDIPILGALFRTTSKTERKSNLLIFLTPHVIDSPEDLQDVYRVKMLQRQEFIRRFYGKTREEQLQELNSLMQYSMNLPGYESVYPDRPREEMGGTISSGDDLMVPRYGSYRGSFAGPGPEDDLPEDEGAGDVIYEDDVIYEEDVIYEDDTLEGDELDEGEEEGDDADLEDLE